MKPLWALLVRQQRAMKTLTIHFMDWPVERIDNTESINGTGLASWRRRELARGNWWLYSQRHHWDGRHHVGGDMLSDKQEILFQKILKMATRKYIWHVMTWQVCKTNEILHFEWQDLSENGIKTIFNIVDANLSLIFSTTIRRSNWKTKLICTWGIKLVTTLVKVCKKTNKLVFRVVWVHTEISAEVS